MNPILGLLVVLGLVGGAKAASTPPSSVPSSTPTTPSPNVVTLESTPEQENQFVTLAAEVETQEPSKTWYETVIEPQYVSPSGFVFPEPSEISVYPGINYMVNGTVYELKGEFVGEPFPKYTSEWREWVSQVGTPI